MVGHSWVFMICCNDEFPGVIPTCECMIMSGCTCAGHVVGWMQSKAQFVALTLLAACVGRERGKLDTTYFQSFIVEGASFNHAIHVSCVCAAAWSV